MMPLQLRFPTELTSNAYIQQTAWKNASLTTCPWHPRESCSFRRHGFYERKVPAGLLVRRWYCSEAHQTVSLLPDFAAAKVSDELHLIEDAVVTFEKARNEHATVEMAALLVRPDIQVQGAIRWVCRRIHWVRCALILLVGIAPDVVAATELAVAQVRVNLDVSSVLVRMRAFAASQLPVTPAPLGFARLSRRRYSQASTVQHSMGADKPP